MKPLRFLLPLSFLGTASFGFGLFDPVAMAKQKQQHLQAIGASRAPPRPHGSNYYARYDHHQGKTQLSAGGAADDTADTADDDDGLIKDSSKTTKMMTIGSSNSADDNDPSFSWSRVSMQFGLFRQMAFPYYRESSASRWLLVGLLVLTLANSGVSVLFSYLGKDFWNALSAKNVDEFYTVLYKYVGALAVGAPLVTMYSYQRAQLKVHWREWMTNRTLSLYVNNKVYYKLDDAIDNPDQRMAEDIRSFTGYSLDLLITVLTSIIDLCSFSLILYSIYPQLFVAIVLYAALGTFITTLLGKVLVNLNFRQLRREADLRYSLVRLRDNAESIAFYGGEDLERRNIKDRLAKAVDNKRKMNAAERNLEFFTNAYRYLVQILPIAVVAPQYFAGAIELGVISQSAGAFSHILSDLSIIINQFEALSTFSAGIERLSGFFESVRNVDVHRNETFGLLDQSNRTAAMGDATDHYYAANGKDIVAGQIVLQTWNVTLPNRPVLSISHLDLVTPDFKRELIRDLSITVETNLLIVGSSGAGKSSLLRAIAGLWTAGNGTIARPSNVYFLPQRPYCTVGTLRDQLLYPRVEHGPDYVVGNAAGDVSDEELVAILDKVDLLDVATRAGDGDPVAGLQASLDWSNMLSLGEQQRLAFGRLLVNKPALVIADEATSALDIASEAKMYSLLRNMAQRNLQNGSLAASPLSYVSVGHRPSLAAFHDKKLRLLGGNAFEVEIIEKSSIDIMKTSRIL